MQFESLEQAVSLFKAKQKELHAYSHAMGVLSYDGDTVAPKGGFEELSETIGILSERMYALSISEENKELLTYLIAHKDELDFQTRREAEELYESMEKNSKIPMEEYVAYSKLISKSQHIWQQAKEANDYAAFEPCLKEIVAYQRKYAAWIAPEKKPYDVLLNDYEKGLTMETLDRYFADVKAKLVPVIEKINASDKKFRTDLNERVYPVELQKKFSDYLMELMTIDRNYCTIGETEHPYTTNFSKHDVRITTNYHENQLASNLFSVIHEGGHALYELHTGDDLLYSSLAGGASMGIHESQSRFFENIIGRSREFVSVIFPKAKELFPAELGDVTEEEFYLFVNKSAPSFIRIEADELTYSLHIMVRYELEKMLMAGELDTADLPAAWNRMYKEYLGVDVPNDKMGVLQDVHWAGGMFGYFPSYSIGSAYASQILESMKKDIPVFELVAKGELQPIVDWLTERIYRFGCLLTPAELIKNCCGVEFDPTFYTDYLTKKYSEVYDL